MRQIRREKRQKWSVSLLTPFCNSRLSRPHPDFRDATSPPARPPLHRRRRRPAKVSQRTVEREGGVRVEIERRTRSGAAPPPSVAVALPVADRWRPRDARGRCLPPPPPPPSPCSRPPLASSAAAAVTMRADATFRRRPVARAVVQLGTTLPHRPPPAPPCSAARAVPHRPSVCRTHAPARG